MKYYGLTKLLSENHSSRRYFLSLPVEMQLELHKINDEIQTASDLREMVDEINKGNNYYNGFNNPSFYL